MTFDEYLIDFIDRAIAEDIGDGDHTTLSTIPAEIEGTAHLLVKEAGVLAGIPIAEKVFKTFDANAQVRVFIEDGTLVKPGDIAFHVKSRVQALLQAERLVLNIMQRMSGIASQTRRYVNELSGLKTKVLDTRKTTPGMRLLEKEAVRIGGGVNHRIGLYDMILIKDNHIDFAGGIEQAVTRAKDYLKKTCRNLKIEVEARTIDDVKTILAVGGVDRIMLDNFSISDTYAAVELIGAKAETESSGGITLENLRSYAQCGVDFISVGALTHQIQSIDLSLKAIDY